MSWIDSRAIQIVCPQCGGRDLIGKRDYDSVQGNILLAYCRKCQPEAYEGIAYEQSYEHEAKAAKLFGREPGWRKFE